MQKRKKSRGGAHVAFDQSQARVRTIKNKPRPFTTEELASFLQKPEEPPTDT